MGAEIRANDSGVKRHRHQTFVAEFLGQGYGGQHVCSLPLTIGSPFVVRLAFLRGPVSNETDAKYAASCHVM